jgi:hypothetical protein
MNYEKFLGKGEIFFVSDEKFLRESTGWASFLQLAKIIDKYYKLCALSGLSPGVRAKVRQYTPSHT